MKKHFLIFTFLTACLFGGALAANAKSLPLASKQNTVSRSAQLSKYRAIVRANAAKCKATGACVEELTLLIEINTAYEFACAPSYQVGCSPLLENLLVVAGQLYEICVIGGGPLAKNEKPTDNTVDRRQAKTSDEFLTR